MAANINDKITSASSGVRPVNTTVSNIRNSGNTTLSCADLTGWPTASAVHFVTYKLDGTGNIVVGTQSDWKGIVSGATITDLVLTGGSDNGNAIGDIVVCLPTARYGKELYDALSLEHKPSGAHKDITADSVATDTILEGTPANGVTIDGLNIKDGKLNTNNSVVTSNVTNAAVTPPKWTNPYKFRARRTSAQNTGNAGFAIVNFNTEDYDTNNNFDVTTNVGRYTVPVNGYYHFDARLSAVVASGSQLLIALYKNGNIIQRGAHIFTSGTGGTAGVTLSVDVYAVAGDYFDIYSFGSGGALEMSGAETHPYFSGHLISET